MSMVVEDDKIRRLRWQNELAKEMRNPLSQVVQPPIQDCLELV
ncbi:hypothetical protein COLO4_37052 [Corchorus olitorius]|uniref:Uncharacterized protein n=1 Tax=Corchorus olitorius TaxID=93759 RepID=A0A1R3G3L1_9ROSI|nr:hypothetical protein COLO4_37052 [Corchorus olitorius]